MNTGKFVGRVGALAVALGVGFAGATAPGVPMAAAADSPSPDLTALIVCGAACPTPDAYIVDSVMNHFITPTHPGQTITPVAVTTPSQYWPIAGVLRLVGLVTGDPRILGPGGAAWPDEPWWMLSGLFDMTAGQSLQAGAADLQAAMAAHGNDHLVIFGDSFGAASVNVVKRQLAEQYPEGTSAPDISFVLAGDPNVPNGGLASRFAGLTIPILDIPFNGPAATDTQFKTVEINRQYDGAADFPLYPLNVIADLNAVMGFLYLHTHPFDVSLPADPTTSPAYQGTYGDTSYYLFPTEHLPLFDPLRQLGVPEPLIDVVEPFFRVLVEMGYDRSIPPWQPTPAQLIPTFDSAKVITDLVSAIGEGINNALALVGLPKPHTIPAPVAPGAPTTKTASADVSSQLTSSNTTSQLQKGTSTAAVIATRKMSTGTTPSTTVTETASSGASPEGAVTGTITAADPQTSPQGATDTLQPTPPKDLAETCDATPTSTGVVEPSATSPLKASATNTSTAKSAKANQPAKRGPVVRDLLGGATHLLDRSHRGGVDEPMTRAGAARAEAAPGASPPVASASTAGSSRDASGSDSQGS